VRNAPNKKHPRAWLIALITWSLSSALSVHGQSQRASDYDFRSGTAIVASLDNYQGQYLLNLTNNTDRELRGVARLSLGSDHQQTEVGQIAVTIPANETKLYLLKGLNAQGEFYTLRLYRGSEALLFYKIAAVRRVNDGVLTKAETIAFTGNGETVNAVSTAPPTAPIPSVSQPTPDEVHIKLRLAAGAQPEDPFVLVFELSGQRSLFNATLQMTLGTTKATKPVSLNLQAVVEFNMPAEVSDGKIAYVLTRKDGSIVTQGETTLDKLFADDIVTVSDIRTDKTGYAPGETARLTVMLEGSSKAGYRLEITAHDPQDSQFFSTVLYGKAGEPGGEQPVQLSLPNDVKERVIVKFKLHDAANNALLDSGERELTIHEKP
jgi:hypothetical protein